MPRSKEKGKKTKLQPVKEKEVLQKNNNSKQQESMIAEADQYRESIFCFSQKDYMSKYIRRNIDFCYTTARHVYARKKKQSCSR